METPPNAAQVVEWVEAHWGEPYSSCELPLLGHDVVLSILLGSKDRLACAACLAGVVAVATDAFLRDAAARVRRLDCYRAGWSHSDRRLAGGPWPEERIPSALRMDTLEGELPETPEASRSTGSAANAATRGSPAPKAPKADERFDAGDMSCGDLVLALRTRLVGMRPGQVLEVVASDPSASADLPAWCGLTRHELLQAAAPRFWIRRRDD